MRRGLQGIEPALRKDNMAKTSPSHACGAAGASQAQPQVPLPASAWTARSLHLLPPLLAARLHPSGRPPSLALWRLPA